MTESENQLNVWVLTYKIYGTQCQCCTFSFRPNVIFSSCVLVDLWWWRSFLILEINTLWLPPPSSLFPSCSPQGTWSRWEMGIIMFKGRSFRLALCFRLLLSRLWCHGRIRVVLTLVDCRSSDGRVSHRSKQLDLVLQTCNSTLTITNLLWNISTAGREVRQLEPKNGSGKTTLIVYKHFGSIWNSTAYLLYMVVNFAFRVRR